jgi:hypothetical protein
VRLKVKLRFRCKEGRREVSILAKPRVPAVLAAAMKIIVGKPDRYYSKSMRRAAHALKIVFPTLPPSQNLTNKNFQIPKCFSRIFGLPALNVLVTARHTVGLSCKCSGGNFTAATMAAGRLCESPVWGRNRNRQETLAGSISAISAGTGDSGRQTENLSEAQRLFVASRKAFNFKCEIS